jgi:hypothetical protein
MQTKMKELGTGNATDAEPIRCLKTVSMKVRHIQFYKPKIPKTCLQTSSRGITYSNVRAKYKNSEF